MVLDKDTNTNTGPLQDIRMEQAIFALRRGSAVLVRDLKGNCGLVQAAEYADYENPQIAYIPASEAVLCLTPQHMSALDCPILARRPAYSLPVDTISPPQIISLILGDNSLLPRDVSILPERDGTLPAIGIRLLKLAKLLPAALLKRVLIEDETHLLRLAQTHHMPIISEREMAQYENQRHELQQGVDVRLPLAAAPDARMIMFRAAGQREDHFAVIIGDGLKTDIPLVRVHSQCLTGDVLGSLKCDCGPQLQAALQDMQKAGTGILIYLAQEGRDIGLLNKMRSYALQDAGFDTVAANHRLGFEADQRVFAPAAQMLKSLGQTRIKLMTNNPDKIEQLKQHGIEIHERVPLILPTNPHNQHYMQTKKDRTGHILD